MSERSSEKAGRELYRLPEGPDNAGPEHANAQTTPSTGTAEPVNAVGRTGPSVLWVLPAALLMAAWMGLTFYSTGYSPADWLPFALALGLAGASVYLPCRYPRRPRQLSLAVLSLLFLFGCWLLASTFWSPSRAEGWLDAGRFFLVVVFAGLAYTFLTESGVRVATRQLLPVVGLILAGVTASRLAGAAGEVPELFVANRLSYPLSDPDAAAALFLLPVWPLVWLAVAATDRAPLRGLALGIATALGELALLTHSRTALAAFALSALLMMALSPARIRTIFYLVVPGVLLLYSFPHLSRYWQEPAGSLEGSLAAWNLLVSFLVAGFAGTLLALLEGWVGVTGRMKMVFGLVLLALVVLGLVRGWTQLEENVGAPVVWALDEPIGSGPESGYDARMDGWQEAWTDFRQKPWAGMGAGSYAATDRQDGDPAGREPPAARYLAPGILAETGLPGALFFFGAVLLALGGILWPRAAAGWNSFRRGPPGRWGASPRDYGWPLALGVAFVYWLIQASIDPLWGTPALTLGAVLLLTMALSEIDAAADVLWPALARGLERLGLRLRVSPQELPSPEDRPSRGLRDGLSPFRRSDRYEARRARRLRRDRRRAGARRRLSPPGLLSEVFRWAGGLTCLGLSFAVLLHYLF